jgi:methionyl-tRNA formyltransferase
VSFNDIKYPVIASQNETVEMLARMADVPGIKLFDDSEEYVGAIKSCKPDVIIVSCLARKLPDKILSIPRLGCFNLHPSLLPAFRGPVPLFWQFREGIEDFGMSLHRMISSIDTGPIIAQSRLSMPDGITNQHVSEVLARAGATLLEQTLDKISRGEITERIQNESEASVMSYPKDSDFVVSTAWTARRMYNFICATGYWGRTYLCEISGWVYQLIEATSYRTTTVPEMLFSIKKDIITIPCADGVVTARLVPDIPLIN